MPPPENIHPSKPHNSPKSPNIAICGIGFRLPSNIRTCSSYWDLLLNGKDARGPIPASRYNVSGFSSELGAKNGVKIKHGYFIDEDLRGLDTNVFSMTRNELENCDPQQRMLLEVTRECLEDAGEVNYKGKSVGVYVGTFGDDWQVMSRKDSNSDQGGGYSVTGHLDLMLANRVSYEFDLKGPSMALKTGCSACRAIQTGDAISAVVAGTSLIMTPALTTAMTALELLSPDGSCKAFDAAANGFARAEAINAIYIKSLDHAIRDGNVIRAVIKGMATNSDGRGPSLVTPNGEAQEALMKMAYRDCGLDPGGTAFVECHGTGISTGDPIETTAVGKVFGSAGVYIGSVKPNLGHSEGASGLSSVIKCVLALEHGVIPPNIKLQNPNPKIPFGEYKLVVPTVPTPFPEDRMRISINSLGIGGTNVHAILESYTPNTIPRTNLASAQITELLLFSANTETSLKEQICQHQEYILANPPLISDIAYKRAIHREHFPHNAFAIVQNGEFISTATTFCTPQSAPTITMIFSGQGAQWFQMGRELIESDPDFRNDIERMDEMLQKLKFPPEWNLLDELLKPASTSQIHNPDLSQPLNTALQLALYNKLAKLGIIPSAVIGHSSGEIAAAYAARYLSMEEAIIVAYYRGYVTGKQNLGGSGKMAVIGLGVGEVKKFLERIPGVVVACENSPESCTISGDEEGVCGVVDVIGKERPDVLVKRLKVGVAYHSGMEKL